MQFCPHCQSAEVKKKNFYFIKHSRSWVRRYCCQCCKKTFSSRTHSATYHQKKPFLNQPIFEKLASGNTQRRTARLLGCTKNTVARKLIWIAKFLNKGGFSGSDYLHLQIDELETIEHTKLKPLTIPLCVNHKYKILDFTVGKIKAKGHLAEIALKKYGPREDQRIQALTELFENLQKQLPKAPLTITTDAHPLYPGLVRKFFPGTHHVVIHSRDHLKKKRELIYTAERKKIFDPMFALNQRCAMLRADIRRLSRRSWCTTKKIENLKHHLKLYQAYNNLQLSMA
jgi:transposase-like protein